jgi:hypothetical protein
VRRRQRNLLAHRRHLPNLTAGSGRRRPPSVHGNLSRDLRAGVLMRTHSASRLRAVCRRRLVALVGGCAVVGFTLLVLGTGGESASKQRLAAARRFGASWREHDYTAMYADLDTSSRRTVKARHVRSRVPRRPPRPRDSSRPQEVADSPSSSHRQGRPGQPRDPGDRPSPTRRARKQRRRGHRAPRVLLLQQRDHAVHRALAALAPSARVRRRPAVPRQKDPAPRASRSSTSSPRRTRSTSSRPTRQAPCSPSRPAAPDQETGSASRCSPDQHSPVRARLEERPTIDSTGAASRRNSQSMWRGTQTETEPERIATGGGRDSWMGLRFRAS